MFALNVRWHSQIMLGKRSISADARETLEEASEVIDEQEKGVGEGYIRWARLLKPVFDIDIEICLCRGGQLKIMPKMLRGAGSSNGFDVSWLVIHSTATCTQSL